MAEELRVLTAPLVTEKAKRKNKPKTAKEALRARAEQQRSPKNPAKRAPKAARQEEPEERDEEESPKSDRDSEPSSSPRPPESFWARLKGLFRRG